MSLGNKKSVPKWGNMATLDYRRRHASNASPPSAARISVEGSGVGTIASAKLGSNKGPVPCVPSATIVRLPVSGSIANTGV